MRNLTLLASYPKSGNTWFRSVIEAIRSPSRKMDINRLTITNASDRTFIDTHLGIPSSGLLPSEFHCLRQEILSAFYWADENHRYLKVHDAYLPLGPNRTYPFPEEAIQSVIYIVRDPRDVAISFAHHLDVSIDQAIKAMNNHDFLLTSGTLFSGSQVPQLLSTWGNHVSSWINKAPFRSMLVRYEDMLLDPCGIFHQALAFAGEIVSTEVIPTAVDAVSFEKLKSQERQYGFRERSRNKPFFRNGKSGDWKSSLSQYQIDAILAKHGKVMKQVGYYF